MTGCMSKMRTFKTISLTFLKTKAFLNYVFFIFQNDNFLKRSLWNLPKFSKIQKRFMKKLEIAQPYITKIISHIPYPISHIPYPIAQELKISTSSPYIWRIYNIHIILTYYLDILSWRTGADTGFKWGGGARFFREKNIHN